MKYSEPFLLSAKGSTRATAYGFSQCLTLRAYPEREDSRGVSLFARGSAAKLVSLDAWQMRSVWPQLKDRTR